MCLEKKLWFDQNCGVIKLWFDGRKNIMTTALVKEKTALVVENLNFFFGIDLKLWASWGLTLIEKARLASARRAIKSDFSELFLLENPATQ